MEKFHGLGSEDTITINADIFLINVTPILITRCCPQVQIFPFLFNLLANKIQSEWLS
jgi:hypothetical protein